MSQKDVDRYLSATHAMQSGIAMILQRDPTLTEDKHVRVGINSSMVQIVGLAKLLLDKKVFTIDEYEKYLADAAEDEVKRYEQELSEAMGGSNIIHLL